MRSFLFVQHARILGTIAPHAKPSALLHGADGASCCRPSWAQCQAGTGTGTIIRPEAGFSRQRRHNSSATQITEDEREKQRRTPWHREGSDTPPVKRPRSAGAMVKGKLLTTPSKLLKLVIPLKTTDANTDRKDVQPLVLLVHPTQPLSYLERLIQSELPNIRTDDGKEKIPKVNFMAENQLDDAVEARAKREKQDTTDEDMYDDAEAELGSEDASIPATSPRHQQPTSPDHERTSRPLVRWSTSTEIGDFIREAARSHQFSLSIQSSTDDDISIPIAVPSFNDRTHYLRQRLRKTAGIIKDMAALKRECDVLAHRGGQRVALAGAGALVGYWYIVYRLTFETDLGWDTMEPVTYLVGLSTLILGYLWFLYHNREISYRSALNLTISRRQAQLYARKGFDNATWEATIEEANGYRREIKQIAREYDVEWDERVDERDKIVTEAMRQERRSGNSNKKDSDEDDDEGSGSGKGGGKGNRKKADD